MQTNPRSNLPRHVDVIENGQLIHKDPGKLKPKGEREETKEKTNKPTESKKKHNHKVPGLRKRGEEPEEKR